MKTSRKRLKASLTPGVKKFGLAFVVPKLGKFLLFNDFLDLDVLRDLDKFWPFDFSDFLASSLPLPPILNPTTLPPNPTTLPSPFFTLGPDRL